MPEKRKNQNDGGMPLKRIAVCSIIGTVLLFLEIIGFSALELKLDFGTALYFPVGVASAFLSGFTAGFAAVIKDKKKAAPIGAVTGAIEVAISDVFLVLVNNGEVGKNLIFMNLSVVAGSVIGAVAAAGIRRKIRY